MAYTKTNWENAPLQTSPINADNLNNIENGIASADTEITAMQEVITNLRKVFDYLPEYGSISINRVGDTGAGSISWGGGNESSGVFSVSFGTNNVNKAMSAVAIGNANTLNTGATQTLIVGTMNTANAESCFVTGVRNTASSSATYATIVGADNVANADIVFMAGQHLTASSAGQIVIGKSNVADTVGKYVFIVGGGAPGVEKNAFAVDWSGNAEFAGTITSAGNLMADKQYVDTSASNTLTSAGASVDTKLTSYLTETQVYDAIAEKATGTFKNKGSVATRANLPTTATDFDLYHITDEGVDVYARNIDGSLSWLPFAGGSTDLSSYETVTGATEKMNAAVTSSQAYTNTELAQKLGVGDKAADTSLFGGQLPSYYSTSAELQAEAVRATGVENRISGEVSTLTTNLQTEISRALGAESTLSGNISSLTGNLQSEITRATGAENSITAKYDALIPAQASGTNQLSDKDFVNSSINRMAAHRVTFDADGNPFPTNSDLLNATTVYHGGVSYTPSEHDYCTISVTNPCLDERYLNGQTLWEYDGTIWNYIEGINERPFTAAENAVLSSGATAEIISSIAGKINKPTLYTAGHTAVFDVKGNVVDGGMSGTSSKVSFNAVLYAANWTAITGGFVQTVDTPGTLATDSGNGDVDTVGRDLTTADLLKKEFGKITDIDIRDDSIYVRATKLSTMDIPIFWESAR